jgi:hypothetical protein
MRVGPYAILVVVAAALVGAPVEVEGQAPASRSFSLDSRYFVQTHSNVAAGQFGVDMANLTTLTADLISPGSRLRDAGRGLSVLVTSFYLGEAFSLAYHEYGHGTRNAAVGFGSLYGFGTLRTAEDAQAALAAGGLHDNFLTYYLGSITTGTGGFALRTTEGAPFNPLSAERRSELAWDGLRRAGGMNNEMFFSELIEDEVYRNGGHVGFFSGYVKGKLSASGFSSSSNEFGDIGRVVSFYQAQGLAIDQDAIEAASWKAFLLSTLSYQVTYTALGVFVGQPFRFRPWTVRGIEPPNTSFYMNRDGLSLKVRSGYGRGAWRFPVSVERIIEGVTTTEVGAGVQRRGTPFGFDVHLTAGRRLEGQFLVRYLLRLALELSGGYTLFDQRNLSGARLIPSLQGGSVYHGVHVRLAFLY